MGEDILKLLTLENVVFRQFVFWSSILLLKTVLMSVLTGINRHKTKTFANEEDLPSKKLKVKFDDPDVERIRRAHRNDLENILPFIMVSFFYVLTNPSAYVAINLFRISGVARILHTFVYAIYVLPQPARALSWFIPFVATVYMAAEAIIYFGYRF